MIRKWDKSKPPKGAFALNLSAPLARGIVAWYPFGGSAGLFTPDRAGTSHMLGVGSLPYRNGSYNEPVISFSGNTANYFNCASSPIITFPVSLTARCIPTASQTSVPIGISASGSATDYIFLALIAGPADVRMQYQTGAAAQLASSTANYVVNQQTDIVGTATSASVCAAYLNGANKGAASGTPGTPSNLNTTQIGLEAAGGTPTLAFTGTIGECAIYNVVITDLEAQIHADPARRFELWYPLRSQKWFSMASGGGVTTRPVKMASYWGGFAGESGGFAG